MSLRSIPLTAWMCFVCAAIAHNATAQQTYTLTPDDAWTSDESLEPGTPEAMLADARRALAEGDARRAENLATRWIERHDRHPLMPDAYLLRGDAKLAQQEHYKALYDYEYVARVYPGSEAFVTALERELQIAKLFVRGTKRKFLGFRILSATEEAQELLIRIQERMPGSRLGEDAGMELADFYFRGRDMSLAAEAYELFIENYPNSEQISKARRRLIYSHLASFKGPRYSAAGLNEAKMRLEDLKAVEPVTAQQIGADALIVRIDESNAAKLLENARWYLKRNDPIAAELTIRRLVNRHLGTVAAAEALQLVPSILPQLPERVRQAAPDYDALRAGVLGAKTEASQ
ncbi:MAG TPA: outer membrane protein assembly factor BamD [Phycisphaerales bacterium]|nr:outer membrane protein assembly factor BamD [Phycisphaerales bacterium]